MIKTFLIITSLCIGIPAIGQNQTISTEDSIEISQKVDNWAADLMAERRIPGMSLVVIQNGDIVKSGHYGLANVEHNVPVNEETSFKIASMSKAFTAAALMLLVEDGTVGLDDPVTNHLDGLPPAWADITLRQLANHTSGLSNDWDLHPGPGTDPDDWTINSSDYFLHNSTDEAFLNALADLPLLFSPGEGSSYAAGTFVIGLVIANVSEMPYAEFMRTRIFEPLGMTRTMINDASLIVPHRASGYRLETLPNGKLMNGYRISQAAEARGDVGVLTTALDLAKWDAAFRDTRLFSQASLDMIAEPSILNDGSSYPDGLGWNLLPFRGLRAMWHGGAFRTGFNSVISRLADGDLTVIALANQWGAFYERHIDQEIAGFYDPAFRSISTMQPRTDPDPDRTHLLRNVIQVIGSGSVDPVLMTEDFPIGLYAIPRWQERHDGLQSFTFIDCQDRSGEGIATSGEPIHEVCYFKFAESRGTGYLVYSLTDDGRVADLYTEEFTLTEEHYEE